MKWFDALIAFDLQVGASMSGWSGRVGGVPQNLAPACARNCPREIFAVF